MENRGTSDNKMSSDQDLFQSLKENIASFKRAAPNECARLLTKEFVWVLGEMEFHKKSADQIGFVTRNYLDMIGNEFNSGGSDVSSTEIKEKRTTKAFTSPKKKDDNSSSGEKSANDTASTIAGTSKNGSDRDSNLDAKNTWFDRTLNSYKDQLGPIINGSDVPKAVVFQLIDFQNLDFGPKVGMIKNNQGVDSHRWDTDPHQACIYFLKQTFKKMDKKDIPKYKVPKIDPRNPSIKVSFTENTNGEVSRFASEPTGIEDDENTENGEEKSVKNDVDDEEEELDIVDAIMHKMKKKSVTST